MNTGALLQAMKEREMIELITELMKFRERYGKERFNAVLTQMRGLLDLNKDNNFNRDFGLETDLKPNGGVV